jgi:hypothetical protein
MAKNHTRQRENWVKFLAEGENPAGMVSQVPDETTVNGRGAEFRSGGYDRQVDERVVLVREHTRKKR